MTDFLVIEERVTEYILIDADADAEFVAAHEEVIEMIEIAAQGPAGRDGSALGWAFYKDAEYTETAKRTIPANVRTRITCDGLSPLTNEEFKPAGAVWFDPQTSEFVADAPGDSFAVRLNLKMTSNLNNRTVTIDFDIGTANYPVELNFPLSKGAGFVHKQSFFFPVDASAGFVANRGKLHIVCNGDLEIWDISVRIGKTNQV